LSVPLASAVTLGLELIGTELVELTDGSRKQELQFRGTASILGKQRAVSMFVADSAEALIGTELMRDCRLTIDFPRERVELTRASRRR
jgi:hypothetical protein